MKYKRKNITKKRYIINPLTIRAEIKHNLLLSPFLGHWNGCRVSGWGHYHGYIQIESKLIECNQISRTDFKDICENVYTVSVELFAEFDHAKSGWTEEHLKALKDLLAKYNLILTEKK